METVEEEIVCMETNIFENVGPAACIEPPKRRTQAVGQARSSNVLSFVSDHRGIGSCKRSIKVAEDEELIMEKSTFANVIPIAYTRPPKRPAQTTSYASVSMGAPGVAVLLQDRS